jgi:hypothetical protein
MGEMMVLQAVLSVFRWLFAQWEGLPPGVKSNLTEAAEEAFDATLRAFYRAVTQDRATR